MLERIREAITDEQHEVLEPELPHSAVLMPITNHGSEPQIILTQRSAHLSRHAGEVCFPGGKKDDSDGSLLETALRESQEEVGLEQQHVLEVVGQLRPLVSRSGLNVVPYVAIVDKEAPLVPNLDELDSIFKVPLPFFLDSDNVQSQEIEYRGQNITIPVFYFEGYSIWGLTAFLIVDLVNRAFDADISFHRV